MRLRREAGTGAVLLVAFALFGCASPTGTWGYDDGATVMNLTLSDNGKCVIVVGGRSGKFTEGFGGYCTYTLTDNIVSITAIGLTEKGSIRPVSPARPIQFRIEPSGDITALNGDPRLLKRTSK